MASGVIQKSYVKETHTFSTSLTSGTIGTRGAQLTWTPTNPVSKLVGIAITYISSSADFNPLVFASGGTIYCNFYRASGYSANAEVQATFLFER